MYLNPMNREIGRRNFLKAVAAIPGLAGAGAFTYSFVNRGEPVKVGFIGIGNEGRVLMNNADPDFIKVVAVADIYPVNREMAQRIARVKFDNDVKAYADYRELLADKGIEAVITAAPLNMHHQITMDALNAGKHVLCEKLMAYTIGQCKEMIALAEKKGLVLQIGHQRHYSDLYRKALALIAEGTLGDIYHIKACWHRQTKWSAPVPKEPKEFADFFAKARTEIENPRHPAHPAYEYKPDMTKKLLAALEITPTEAEAVAAASTGVDYAAHGYDNYQRFRNWRLYKKTSQGLMAELGSHQMDACGIILGHAHPKAVQGFGHKVTKDDREVYDHIYVQYEFPKDVVVTYSSITSNKFENYGEIIYGTKGTMFIEQEKDVLLFDAAANAVSGATATEMSMAPAPAAGKAAADTSGSVPLDYAPAKPAAGAAPAAEGWTKPPSRGYREEIQHFAICIRSNGKDKPRCDGRQALSDAVVALKANEAMDQGKRIVFDEKWFDPASPEA